MKEGVFLVLVGLSVVTIQTTSFAFVVPSAYKPDLILIVVAWASLRTSFSMGIGFAFVSGLWTDLLSGTPTGLFAIVYSLFFLACGYTDATFRIDGHAGRVALTVSGTVFAGLVVLLSRWLEGPVSLGWNTGLTILTKSILTGLCAIVLFPALDRGWHGYSRLLGVR